MIIMTHQIKISIKKLLKRLNGNPGWSLKIVTGMKKSLEGLKSSQQKTKSANILEQYRLSSLKDGREKKKKNEKSLRSLWDTI